MRATFSLVMLAILLLLLNEAAAQPVSRLELVTIIEQANELVGSGDYAAAQVRFEKAIAESRWDRGKSYATHIEYDKGVDPQRKAYGEAELGKILRDRPHMNAHGIADSEIARWCAYRLAGIETGLPVRWDNQPPKLAFMEHEHHDDWIAIRIADEHDTVTKQRMFEASWAALVFELINATYRDDFAFFGSLAKNKEISKQAYIKGMFRTEMAAMAKCRAFYVRVFLPWADNAGILSHSDRWYTRAEFWGVPDDVLKLYHDKSGYPWQPYGGYYDSIAGRAENAPESDAITVVKNVAAAIRRANEVARVENRITNEGGTTIVTDGKIEFRGGTTVIHGGERKVYVEGGELTVNGGENSVFDLRE